MSGREMTDEEKLKFRKEEKEVTLDHSNARDCMPITILNYAQLIEY